MGWDRLPPVDDFINMHHGKYAIIFLRKDRQVS